MSTVVFAVPSRVHLLDLAGPAQAFSAAVDFGAETLGVPPPSQRSWGIVTVASSTNVTL